MQRIFDDERRRNDGFSLRRRQTLIRHYDLAPFRSKWNRSAGGHLDQGRGLWRRTGWWPGQVRSAMDLTQIPSGRTIPFESERVSGRCP